MGYYVDMRMNVLVPKDKIDDCLKAINALHEPARVAADGSGGRFAGGQKKVAWYSWVNNPENGAFPSLGDALSEWRYEWEEGDEGINIYAFIGEKWGDDELLFNAIAPYVEGDILCHGEDGNLWGYEFEDGKLYETRAEWVRV